MSKNLELYSKVAEVPKSAQKTITAGRLKGMTDINPMWRLQVLTEHFGACGEGWYYEIKGKEIQEFDGQAAAFVDINLYYKKSNGEWSFPIPGTGGSMFATKENKGLHLSDECFKMALTDAISVAAKALGVGANVYWKDGKTKYSSDSKSQTESDIRHKMLSADIDRLVNLAKSKGVPEDRLLKKYKIKELWDITPEDYEKCVEGLMTMNDV